MMDLSNFKILKEDDNNFHVGHPNGKSLMVAKAGLNEKSRMAIEKLKGAPQNLDSGGLAQSDIQGLQQFAQNDSGQGQDVPVGDGPQAFGKTYLNDPQSAAIPSQVSPADAAALPAPVVPQPAARGVASADPYQAEKAANLAGANVIGEKGKTESKDIQNTIDTNQALPSVIDIQNAGKVKDKQLEQAYIDQRIDPDRYWNNKNTGSKIAAGLGLILSGFGAGAAHQQNAAAQFIDEAINRDIESQKNDQSKAMNLWKMNREATGNDIAATLQTQNQNYIALKYKLDKASASFAGPQAQAAAQAANAVIDQKLAMNHQLLALNAGLHNQAGSGTEQEFQGNLNVAQRLAPEQAKDAQSRYVPNVGVAQVPLTPDDRQELTNYSNLKKYLNQAIEFQTAGPGANIGAWSGPSRGAATTIQQNIVSSINQLLDSKRAPNPETAKEWKSIVGNPGSFDIFGTNAARLKQMAQDVSTRQQSAASNLGIKPFAMAPEASAAAAWLKANPNDPHAPAVAQRLQQMGHQL